MKYIDTEKLIAEIRKLCSESCISESDEYYEYAKSEIIDIITSLQQEQPDVDIRKELGRLKLMGSNDARDIQTIARHFYELGLNAKKEE